MTDKIYNFGEKTKENYKTKEGWQELEVWQTPKYLTSRAKAIELIESEKYGLNEADFWILKNLGGKKLCYTGLIISHNGCLKINDKLEANLKFKPSAVSFLKDAGGEKVMQYISDEQGIYDFGEISPDNCRNDYPYAMLIKRLMDRVILKNSKVGFFGIYSEAESEDFKDNLEEKKDKTVPNATGITLNLAEGVDEEMKEMKAKESRRKAEAYFAELKKKLEDCGSVAEMDGIIEKETRKLNSLAEKHNDLFVRVQETREFLKTEMGE